MTSPKAQKFDVSLVRWVTNLTKQQPMDINRSRKSKGSQFEAIFFLKLLDVAGIIVDGFGSKADFVACSCVDVMARGRDS